MQRAVWSGSLAFGLVSIPVRLVSATADKDVRFHLVHAEDGARIRHARVCAEGHEEIPFEELAFLSRSGGAPVVLTREEIDQVGLENTERIDVLDFVRAADVDPVYLERAYYLVPFKGGDRAYRVLIEALQNTRRAGVGRFVMRGKEYLVLVRPLGGVLALSTLNHADEVVAPEDVDGVPREAAGRREVSLAERIIDEMADDFEPWRYHDERRARLLDLIEAKREGAILLPPPRRARERPRELIEALEASLEEARRAAT